MLAPIKMMSAAGGSSAGSVTFTAAGTFNWVAPIGVTSVTVTGRGGSRDVYYTWSSVSSTNFGVAVGTTTYGTVSSSTLAWSTVRSGETTVISNLNGVPTTSTGQYYSSLHGETEYKYRTDGAGWISPIADNLFAAYYRRTGTFLANSSLASKTGNVPNDTSINQSYRPSGGALERRVTNYIYGTDSRAFGYTFPDNAPAATYEDVAVSPLQSYSIVVGIDEGGSASQVTIEWE